MGRREQVLDAAIEVLGADGPRGLTHRAVDAAAGVPAGTTSNHFRSRAALVDGIVARLAALDRHDWEAMAPQPGPDPRPTGVDQLAAALAEYVRYAAGPARTRTAARYGLFLEAASARPELREPLARGREAIVGWGTEWIRQLGSPEPELHCRMVLDYVEGLVLHQMAFPDPGFDPVPGLRAILTAIRPG